MTKSGSQRGRKSSKHPCLSRKKHFKLKPTKISKKLP